MATAQLDSDGQPSEACRRATDPATTARFKTITRYWLRKSAKRWSRFPCRRVRVRHQHDGSRRCSPASGTGKTSRAGVKGAQPEPGEIHRPGRELHGEAARRHTAATLKSGSAGTLHQARSRWYVVAVGDGDLNGLQVVLNRDVLTLSRR